MNTNFDFTHPDQVIRLCNPYALHEAPKIITPSAKVQQEIENLRMALSEIDNEISRYLGLYESKVLDRIGWRELESNLTPRRERLRHELNGILIEHQLRERQTVSAKTLRDVFNLEVLTFSIVEINLDSELSQFMVVPDLFRKKTNLWFEEFEYLSVKTSLASALLRRQVGADLTYVSNDGKNRSVTIMKTQLAPMEVLHALSESFHNDLSLVDVPSANPFVLPRGNGGERRKDQLRPH
jgi:transcription elongation GreA/GreB family factor